MSSRKEAFLVDLIALGNNKVLDEAFCKIFKSEKTTCLGFSFSSDLAEFKKSFKDMTFFQDFAHFLDIQNYYKDVAETQDQIGLANISKVMLGQEICKYE